MPWKEATPIAKRKQLIEDFERGLFNLSELCRQFGVSRKTAYKWLEREQAETGEPETEGHGLPSGVTACGGVTSFSPIDVPML